MSTELATGTCEICGRPTLLSHHKTCRECSELVEAPRAGHQAGWTKTWLATLALVAGGATVYFLAAKYLGPIFVALNLGR